MFRKSHALMGKALAGGRHLTRKELAAVLQKGGIVAAGQRLGHLMMRAELDLVLNVAGLAGAVPLGEAVFTHAVVLDGQVVGHWRRALGDAGTIEARLARPLGTAEARALRAAVERYGRFIENEAGLRVEVTPSSRRRR